MTLSDAGQPLPSADALHEAAHAIIAAYAGAHAVSIVIRNGLPRCCPINLRRGPALVVSFAGYAADRCLSDFTEVQSVQRSHSDAGLRNKVLRGQSDPIQRNKEREMAKQHAINLVDRFVGEIVELARAIDTGIAQRTGLSKEQFELIECVQRVRAIGQQEGAPRRPDQMD